MTKLRKILIAIVAILGIGGGGTAAYLGAQNYVPAITVYDSVSSTSTPRFILNKSYRHLVCEINTVSATATIKFVGTITDTVPSTTIARSVTNSYEYIESYDKQNGVSIDGDTGYVMTGDTDTRMFVLNSDLMAWAAPVITSYTTGTIDVKCSAGDNQ